jgi:TRAP-type C4-dicarboxylate transport system permease small subunit
VRLLEGLVRAALATLLAAASLAILVQVFLRYVLAAPLSWAEEFAVLVFAWIIFLGAALVQASDSHLSIDLLRHAAGPRFAAALDLFRLAVIFVCSAVLIWQGVALARQTLPLEYPAMGVSRAWLYGAVPACFAIGLAFVLRSFVSRLRARG